MLQIKINHEIGQQSSFPPFLSHSSFQCLPLLCHAPGMGSILFPSGFSFKSVKIDKLKKKRIKLKTKESFRKVNINLVNITHT